MSHDLERFVEAQRTAYDGALGEIRSGRKTGHWIWFVFPQVVGLGRSEKSRLYAITSLDEARACLAHPILGTRLRECAAAILATKGDPAARVLGEVDALKLRSSMSLFHRAAPDEPIFRDVLDRFFGGLVDLATDACLRLRLDVDSETLDRKGASGPHCGRGPTTAVEPIRIRGEPCT